MTCAHVHPYNLRCHASHTEIEKTNKEIEKLGYKMEKTTKSQFVYVGLASANITSQEICFKDTDVTGNLYWSLNRLLPAEF